jgi:membrane fusion protein, multidrug efflux system
MSQTGQSGAKTEDKSGEKQKPDGKPEGGQDSARPEEKEQEEQKPKKPPLYKRPAFLISVAIAAPVLLVAGVILWLVLRQYVWTDDAYIDGHVTQISPQISARVLALPIFDNQFVHKDDLLVELDPTDYQVALDEAKAQAAASQGRLEQAKAQIASAQAAVAQSAAEVEAEQVSFDNASHDLRRYQDVDERARSQRQLDNATTAQKSAEAQLHRAKASRTSAEANVVTAQASVKAAEGELQTAQAGENRALVNLSYCKIVAPVDGRVTERTVEVGNYVTMGQALFLLVDPNVWVTANFKETQLTHLRPGQPVMIKVDAFPKEKFRGRVDSIQAGSGSRFSVLPAENATGNYVKVVQRVPVKILFDHDANTNNAPMLSPGLSVTPRVKVR